jgi:hypothetical protein
MNNNVRKPQQPGPFRLALKSFKCSLEAHYLQEFDLTDLPDLKAAMLKIQNRLGNERKLANMRRLNAFLEGMEGCGKVIETFLNTCNILCFVWVRHINHYLYILKKKKKNEFK